MKLRSLLLSALMATVLGGCARTIPPEPPPIPPPPTSVSQTVEGDFLIATRTLPAEIHVGDVFTVVLTVTAKGKLEYILWREIIGGYATTEVSTDEDLEFMTLQIPQGASVRWEYRLRARSVGRDVIDGVIKAVSGPYSEDLRLRGVALVKG
jgi:hypothetical protein